MNSVKSGIVDLSKCWALHAESHAYWVVRSCLSRWARLLRSCLRDGRVLNRWILAYLLFVLLLLLLVSLLLLSCSFLTFGSLDLGPGRLLLILLLLFLISLPLLLGLDALFSSNSLPHSDNVPLLSLSLLCLFLLLLQALLILLCSLSSSLLLGLSYGLLLRCHTLITCFLLSSLGLGGRFCLRF